VSLLGERYGQGTTGTILGTVIDESAAVVAGAEVRATNSETGVKRNTTINSTGHYQMEFLPAGQHTVDIIAPGFSKFEETSIVGVAAQSTRVDAAPNPGSVSNSIEVKGAAPLRNWGGCI